MRISWGHDAPSFFLGVTMYKKCACCGKKFSLKKHHTYWFDDNMKKIYGCGDCAKNGNFDKYIDSIDKK